jgi:hypothetical protein
VGSPALKVRNKTFAGLTEERFNQTVEFPVIRDSAETFDSGGPAGHGFGRSGRSIRPFTPDKSRTPRCSSAEVLEIYPTVASKRPNTHFLVYAALQQPLRRPGVDGPNGEEWAARTE